jgi:hypothetical protein
VTSLDFLFFTSVKIVVLKIIVPIVQSLEVTGSDINMLIPPIGSVKWECGFKKEDGTMPHHLMKADAHGKVCRLCKFKGRTTARGSYRQTRFKCKECDVSLCRMPCFLEYHSEMGIAAAYVLWH